MGRPRKVATAFRRRTAGNSYSASPAGCETPIVPVDVVEKLAERETLARLRDIAIGELGRLPDRVTERYFASPGRGLAEVVSLACAAAQANIRRAATLDLIGVAADRTGPKPGRPHGSKRKPTARVTA